MGKERIKEPLPDSFKSNDPDNNTLIEGDKPIADSFNQFFSDIGENLAKKFPSEETSFQKYLEPIESEIYNFDTIVEERIDSIIRKMKNKKSSSFDNISNWLLKQIRPEITKPLTILVNLSLKNGYIPENYKLAKIVPLYKSGCKQTFGNYRPISLISVLSKILEKIAYQEIFFHFQQHISPNQFGFRPKHETQHCIMNFMNNIYTNKNHKFHLSICLDLQKAFDTCCHSIIFIKLKHYKIQ